jgi:hypothetical protein
MNGNVLWSYPLPHGRYFSLGTHLGSIVIFAGRNGLASSATLGFPVLLFDPTNGNLSVVGTYDGVGAPRYAGDSTFFRIVKGAGEVLTLDNALTKTISGITATAIAAKFPELSLTAPDTMAVLDSGGLSMATVSLNSGAVTASAISSDAVAASRATSQAIIAQAASNPRMATPIFITAIGGDAGGTLYAVVPLSKGGAGLVQVVSFDINGAGTTLGRVQLPLISAGRIAGMASRVVVANSQLGILSYRGDIAWYTLPIA